MLRGLFRESRPTFGPEYGGVGGALHGAPVCVVGVAGQHGNDAPVSVYDGASDSVKEGRQHDISWELGGLRTCLAI